MTLSIITINLNNKEGLAKTFQSIQSQTFQDFEYIVIDGQSTDGSLDLIQKNERINHRVAEKDTGVYDAMNKGIKIASGEYILFLNSGDYIYEAHSIEKVYSHLITEDIIYGDLIFDNHKNREVYNYPEQLNFSFLFKYSLPHPATFIKRKLFEDHGFYETKYKIIADWVFFCKVIAKHHCSTKHVNQIISVFDTDGMSSDPANQMNIQQDRQEFLKQEFPLFYDDYLDNLKNLESLNRIRSSKGFKFFKALGSKKFQ